MMVGPKTPPGYSCAYFEEIDSTNAEALRQAEKDLGEPLWIIAERQHQGRGRRGRTWITAPGNLFTTLLLNWQGPTRILSDLSFVAAVACADVLEQLMEKSDLHAQVRLKWPNDVLLEGAKVGGILIETSNAIAGDKATAVAIGIGLNTGDHPAETLAYPTTDFTEHGLNLTANEVFEHLAISFDHYFALWQGGVGFAPIRQRWLEYGPSMGQQLMVNTGVEVISGFFAGLDDHGGLLVRKEDGAIQTIVAGDVIATPDSNYEYRE